MDEVTIIKTILTKMKECIISTDFIKKHRLSENDFTRKRNISFDKAMLFALKHTKSSLFQEISKFVDDMELGTKSIFSKQAISKARQKISSSAFWELQQMSANIFNSNYKLNTFMNYQLFAVDGTTIQVPDTEENRDYFGYIKAHNSKPVALSRAAILYDVLNDIIIDGKIDLYATDERKTLLRFLKDFSQPSKYTPLFLLDRGYPSKKTIDALCQYKFVMRVSKSFIKEVNNTTIPDSNIKYMHNGKEVELRVIRILLTTGETEILISNIFGKEMSSNDFSMIYHLRWPVETKYNEIKHKYVVEKFTGTKPILVEQDFYATLFMSNITSILKLNADKLIKDEVEQKNLKRDYQTNKNAVIGIFREKFIEMVLHPKRINRILKDILERLKTMRSIIRPDRTRERTRVHTKLNYNLNNKPAL